MPLHCTSPSCTSVFSQHLAVVGIVAEAAQELVAFVSGWQLAARPKLFLAWPVESGGAARESGGVTTMEQLPGMFCARLNPGERMDLLLWRHAEAAKGTPDGERPLTERGLRQARAVAAWLDHRAAADLRVLTSPTRRARQMAALLSRNGESSSLLGRGASVGDVLSLSGWPDQAAPALILTHQPVIGRLAALLLSGAPADWTVRKGALWWFSNRVRRGETQTVLRAMVSPDLIRATGSDAQAKEQQPLA